MDIHFSRYNRIRKDMRDLDEMYRICSVKEKKITRKWYRNKKYCLKRAWYRLMSKASSRIEGSTLVQCSGKHDVDCCGCKYSIAAAADVCSSKEEMKKDVSMGSGEELAQGGGRARLCLSSQK